MPDPTPHQPTEAARRRVSTMVAFGIPQDKIAAIVGVSLPTLRKYYRAEIDIADARAQSVVAKFLFSAASGEALKSGATYADCIRSAMFWMKTRAGWKETAVQELTGKDGRDLIEQMSDDELVRELACLHRGQPVRLGPAVSPETQGAQGDSGSETSGSCRVTTNDGE